MRTFSGADPANQQLRWRSDATPIAQLGPGEEFEVEIPDSSTGQLSERSTRSDLLALDLGRVDAAVGPFAVAGAEPGDALRIRILAVETGVWGWSGVFRDFGLLRDRFETDLVIWRRRGDSMEPARGFLRPVAIPIQPMLGWIGLAPSSGDLGMIPPQRHGGNLDNRLHGVGAELTLPVQRAGGLLMVGDPHAAQGDGEVCGTGIETPARVRLQVDLLKGGSTGSPRLVTPIPPSPPGRWIVTEAVGPEPRSGARDATEQMILELERYGIAAAEAYLLLSVAGQLRLSEVVDEPNWVVSMLFPEELAQRVAE
ncbi:MAG TPA: acetamidase/formamidase family protein, partial [Thermoplasmata archaeon]